MIGTCASEFTEYDTVSIFASEIIRSISGEESRNDPFEGESKIIPGGVESMMMLKFILLLVTSYA